MNWREDLAHKYPHLYSSPHIIECGDGWRAPIEKLSEKLGPLGIECLQAKEKFGGLRYYLSDYSLPEATLAVADTERECWHICERCGEHGEERDFSGWFKILCDNCTELRKSGR